MRNRPLLLKFVLRLLLLLSLIRMPQVDASEPTPVLRIIAHPEFQPAALTVDEIRAIFLFRRTQAANGVQFQPIVRNSGAAHEQFCESFLEKTSLALDSFYRSRLFSGTGFAPRAFSPEAALQQHVARTKGAISYILESSPIAGVKVVLVKANATPREASR